MNQAWKIEVEARALYEALRRGVIALGWPKLGDLRAYPDEKAIKIKLSEYTPQHKESMLDTWASALKTLTHDIKVGDAVVVYDHKTRQYWLGHVTGGYSYDPLECEEWPNLRQVQWYAQIPRSQLSVKARNALGAVQSCQLRQEIWQQLDSLSRGDFQPGEQEAQSILSARQDMETQARELIADRIDCLSEAQIIQLVAGLVRAMGFVTKQPHPSNSGLAVEASLDGLGLHPPHVKVRVEHRQGVVNGEVLRELLDCLKAGDKGIFVSTCGFNQEATYEAERADHLVALMDMDQLVDILLVHYESLDLELKSMIPLTRIYWPAS
ncbi:restriction endonuclease [Pseudomonas asuensis]|jgi:restriction system protein|uniref:Restriction endonuclease n=1 Tax=Pseudomonas asuensis TaxID=1825787 RepID=A0ABQ2H200_9PSED|nr:restriction endonuclease [Pseudomonas asuensis]GGM22722.1 restriction endonuclease [Pseudomonas asuensis]